MAKRIAGFIDKTTQKVVSTLDIGGGRRVHRSIANLAGHRGRWGWLFEADAAGTLVPFDWTPQGGLVWLDDLGGPRHTEVEDQTVRVWLVSVAKRTK